nr:hypothetical protein [Pseudomonas sp. YeP6b]
MGHPWPIAAKPASCRFTHAQSLRSAIVVNGAPQIKIKSEAKAA